MNSSLIVLLGLLCCSAVMAGYTRTYYGTGHKTHLGGAAYGHHPAKYVASHYGHGLTYAKPIVHHPAPIVYAHKSYSKPHVTHYIKPAVHPVISKPFYLGGHGHGIGYKPVVYGHAAHPAVYAHKHYHH
ncbi:uncharacterized protein TNIN_171862 [Trichonephila inaurata madagascariensis]|uniref:Uncharacterized protein n=1 Tax=Trichonephila inaurata madagascariensis TaxID=2747483 RepID=A0A8X6YHE7_9ARAC|nr:uncharacterized protein TNIN_171862 [Trichonephila inaurata madagascariensis]